MGFFDRMRDVFGAFDRDGALARALNLARDRDLNLDLSSALEVARTLASVLGSDRAPVLDQARDLAGGLVRDLSSARDSDWRGHRHHALNRATETARDLVQALDVALDSVLEGDYVSDRADNPDLDLSGSLASALAKCHDLLRVLASYPDVDGDRDLASDFAYYRDVAQDLARYLDQHSARPSGPDAQGSRPLPGRVALAVWLLPLPWQARYREECHAELAQLGRAERNEYARGVLAAAWPLRKELKGTPCPPDGARAGE
ncbi:MAG: hypothetical protein ACRDRD_14090 [Pseudonocardiaceae bacterium]